MSKKTTEECMAAVRRKIENFDRTYSRFRTDSLVSQMAMKADSYILPDDAKPLLELYRRLYDLTNGAVTPLIGQVMVEAGYDAVYSFKEGAMKSPPSWDEAFSFEAPILTMKQPMLLDVGAAGKGYLVDIVGGVLSDHGALSYCIDAGGDLLHHGSRDQKLRVGLENPSDTSEVIGVATIDNQSICGSAGNRRTWGRFHHLIHPQMLVSPSDIQATWVVAPSALVADGLATALFFVSPVHLVGQFEFDYLLVRDDGTIDKSSGFPAELFT